MKEIVYEGIKLTNLINIDVKQSSMTYINNLMKDVIQRYQQAFAHKADAFSNTIGPNTSVNRPLSTLCGTTHKQCFKRHLEHAALSQCHTKMSCGQPITQSLPQATIVVLDKATKVNFNTKKVGNKCGF